MFRDEVVARVIGEQSTAFFFFSMPRFRALGVLGLGFRVWWGLVHNLLLLVHAEVKILHVLPYLQGVGNRTAVQCRAN